MSGDDVIRAKVAGTVISQYDVELAALTSFGQKADLDAKARKNVLESLITSRAIALAREQELTDQERAALDRSVARVREQLLVEQYIAAHYPPKRIEDAEALTYYGKHAEAFGAKTERSFQLLTCALTGSAEQRQKDLAHLSEVAQSKDWKQATTATPPGRAKIELQSGTGTDQVLDPRLRNALGKLSPGQTSATIMIDDRAYVLQVTGEHKTPPKPFKEVSETVRKSLAAQALKSSVSQAAEDVRKRTAIEYPKNK